MGDIGSSQTCVCSGLHRLKSKKGFQRQTQVKVKPGFVVGYIG